MRQRELLKAIFAHMRQVPKYQEIAHLYSMTTRHRAFKGGFCAYAKSNKISRDCSFIFYDHAKNRKHHRVTNKGKIKTYTLPLAYLYMYYKNSLRVHFQCVIRSFDLNCTLFGLHYSDARFSLE